jgi:hypothetical protein
MLGPARQQPVPPPKAQPLAVPQVDVMCVDVRTNNVVGLRFRHSPYYVPRSSALHVLCALIHTHPNAAWVQFQVGRTGYLSRVKAKHFSVNVPVLRGTDGHGRVGFALQYQLTDHNQTVYRGILTIFQCHPKNTSVYMTRGCGERLGDAKSPLWRLLGMRSAEASVANLLLVVDLVTRGFMLRNGSRLELFSY